jgi:hypothetical protein
LAGTVDVDPTALDAEVLAHARSVPMTGGARTEMSFCLPTGPHS